jgi:hypothetical protein
MKNIVKNEIRITCICTLKTGEEGGVAGRRPRPRAEWVGKAGACWAFRVLGHIDAFYEDCQFFGIRNDLLRGLHRDVVYLGGPIAPSYMSPNAGGRGGVAGSKPMTTAVHRSQNKLWRSNCIFYLWIYCILDQDPDPIPRPLDR